MKSDLVKAVFGAVACMGVLLVTGSVVIGVITGSIVAVCLLSGE